ncbi:MAG: histidine kinase [Burkholderiaceae bacterium]
MISSLPAVASWRIRLNESFAGITWRGLALAIAICLIDAVQDDLEFFIRRPFLPWLSHVLTVHFFTAVLLALLLILVVVGTLNRFSKPGVRQSLAVAIAVIVTCALGTLLKLHWGAYVDAKSGFLENYGFQSQAMLAFWFLLRYLIIGGLFAAVYTMRRREQQRLEALQRTELDRARLREQMDEARLQALAAQIEPHFLFNTLANVRSLYQTEPAAATSMLDKLTRYLTIALPRMREADSTLDREAALAEAYLGIQQIRMGSRLAFSIHVPDDLRRSPMPPMMLLTLVENAIKHGIAPLPEGGAISISATRADGKLIVQVVDTGRGFVANLGSGAGLANIRARLRALYGSSARLGLGLNRPRGVTATLVLPVAGAEVAA